MPDRRELYPNLEETIRMALQSLQSRIWTALPGIVQRFDATRMTVDVQPTINGIQRNVDGSSSPLQMPVLLDCPVVYQGGGGVTFTFPIAAGDECLVIFSARCLDAWWATGEVRDPSEKRMHNLSDGFAIVGLRSLPHVIDSVSTTKAQIRKDDGTTFIELEPAANTVKITAPGQINLNGVTIDSSGNIVTSGNINSSGTITGSTDVVGGGKSLKTHTHPQSGGGTTGPPT